MYYFGGKTRIASQIVRFLNLYHGTRVFVEPFVGGASIVSRMTGERHAYDLCEPLITLYQAIQQGWMPPEKVSKEDYLWLKGHQDPSDPMTAFAGFGCSFAGKYFRGYASDAAGRNFATIAQRSLLRKAPLLQDVRFAVADYATLNYENALIYCDPPYASTEPYKSVEEFDHGKFWQVMRDWSQHNVVLISEYNAPSDFKAVLQIPTSTYIRNDQGVLNRVECLFAHANSEPALIHFSI